jgi:hypothetical protein
MVMEDLGNTRNKYYKLVKKLESIQRYDVGIDLAGDIDEDENKEGEWVKWEDIEKLIK